MPKCLMSLFLKVFKEIFNYPRVILVYQPTETLANPFFKKTEYLNQACYKKTKTIGIKHQIMAKPFLKGHSLILNALKYKL